MDHIIWAIYSKLDKQMINKKIIKKILALKMLTSGFNNHLKNSKKISPKKLSVKKPFLRKKSIQGVGQFRNTPFRNSYWKKVQFRKAFYFKKDLKSHSGTKKSYSGTVFAPKVQFRNNRALWLKIAKRSGIGLPSVYSHESLSPDFILFSSMIFSDIFYDLRSQIT